MNDAPPTPDPDPVAAPRRRRIWIAVFTVGAAAFLTIFFVFDPTQHNFFPRCWLHKSTGFHCPGCGGQRALHALINGDVPRAFGHNFFIMAALPFFGWRFGRKLWWRIKKVPPQLTQPQKPIMTLTVVVAVIVFGIIRNLPMEPFSLLAP